MVLHYLLADRLVLQPTRDQIETADLSEHWVDWPEGRIQCFVWTTARSSAAERSSADGGRPSSAGERAITAADRDATASPPDWLVFKLPGTGGRAERSTPFPAPLLDGSAQVWTWNPPGYGRSTGRSRLRDMARAAESVYEFLMRQIAGPATRLLLVGNSLGNTSALHLGATRRVDGMILRNPPPLRALITDRNRWWNLWRGGTLVAAGIPPELDAFETAHRCRAPTVFLQSGADSLVTPAMQQRVREAYGGPWRLVDMPGLEHHEPPRESDAEAIREAIQWLAGEAQRERE